MTTVTTPQAAAGANTARAQILQLEATMREGVASGALRDATGSMPLRHHFIPGAYARELHIPAGTLASGKIHREPCFNILLLGTITLFTEEGRNTVTAPAFFRSEAGTKRVAYAHTDSVFMTVHATDETDLQAIERKLTCKDYSELEAPAVEVLA
jgi:hypothetical protein